MSEATKVADFLPRKPGRPYTGGLGKQLSLRLQPDALAALDDYRRNLPGLPTRQEALRTLIARTPLSKQC